MIETIEWLGKTWHKDGAEGDEKILRIEHSSDAEVKDILYISFEKLQFEISFELWMSITRRMQEIWFKGGKS